jgi:hypothetical protein
VLLKLRDEDTHESPWFLAGCLAVVFIDKRLDRNRSAIVRILGRRQSGFARGKSCLKS